MRLIYFDEAGTASEAQEPITVVAAVLIHGDSQWRPVEDYLDSIIATKVPEGSRRVFREFHAKELFHSGSAITDAWGKEKRWEVFAAFLETFGRFDVPIIWTGTHRIKLKDKIRSMAVPDFDVDDPNVPRTFAFIFTLQAANQWFRDNAPDETGICIADETDFKMADVMKLAFRTYRKEPMIAGVAFTKLDHLIDAISFRESHESIGVQLADACNFLIKRHEMGKGDSEPFYQMIRLRLAAGLVFPQSMVVGEP